MAQFPLWLDVTAPETGILPLLALACNAYLVLTRNQEKTNKIDALPRDRPYRGILTSSIGFEWVFRDSLMIKYCLLAYVVKWEREKSRQSRN